MNKVAGQNASDPTPAGYGAEPHREQPTLQSVMQHVCLSGSPACSGCNPCPECREHVQSSVLPSAFIACRMNETLLILHSLIGALLEKGVDPRALGVDLTRVFPTLEEQGDAFFAGYVDGWNRMHEGMRTSPAMRGRLVIRNVSADDQVGEVLQAPGDQASGPEESEKKPESPLNPFQQALLEQQKQWDLEEQQEQATLTENARAYAKQQGQTAPVADPPKPKPVPITVEEVASSGFVVAEHPETIRNGSA